MNKRISAAASDDSVLLGAGGPAAARFDNLKPGAPGGSDMNLDVILDVPVQLSLEVGRTRSRSATCCSSTRAR